MGGSGAGGAEPSGIPPTFETFKLVLQQYGCVGSDCHGGNEFNPLNLALDDGLYERITTFVSTKCENLPFIDPGNPEGSALFRSITGPCGMISQMPDDCIAEDIEGGGCVRPDHVAPVEEWIRLGAPEE
jgi:hypothetical protein